MSSKNILLSFVVVLLFFVPQLEAKMLITYGDDIVKAADLPSNYAESVKQMTGAQDVYIGYKYGQFGVFFLQIWTWGGEYCLYSESKNMYWTLEKDQIADLSKNIEGGLKTPSAYSYPPGMFVVIVLIAVVVIMGRGGDDEEEAPAEEGEKPAEA